MKPVVRFIGSLLLSAVTFTLQAQVIEPAPGQSLTITEDINLTVNKALRSADTVLLKTSNSSVGNLFLGLQAGTANTTATNNTFLGARAGFNSTGAANTFVGYSAGRSNTTGQFNTFIGTQAGLSNTTGEANFFLGVNAGVLNTTGSGNFFVGNNAGASNSAGGFNVFLGTNAGSNNGTGSNNTAIGYEAGGNISSAQTNTLVGFRANAGLGNLTNAGAIGANAVVSISNALVLGSGANIGIGTSSPTAKLHVTSGTVGQSGLRLENLTSSATASINSSKFLTVDGSGNVVLGNYASGGRQGVTAEADVLWQRKNGYLRVTKDEAVIIGSALTKMPTGYRLFVQDGILTEKVKVAVKNTGEWSDKVFETGYSLKSLAEVQQYIQAHKHLPGIPSAKEMVERGNDLHQTDAKLLEKIEELTLYSIQLETQLRDSDRKHQQELQELKHKQAQLEQLVQEVLRRK